MLPLLCSFSRASRTVLFCAAFCTSVATFPGVALADAILTLSNGAQLYSTGIDVSGGVDQRYTMTLNPYDGSPTVNTNSAGYLSPNDANSGWVGPAQANIGTPESVYRMSTTVDLTGVNLSGFAIVGYWVTDNQGLDILVNGASTGFTNNGNHPSHPTASEANRFELTSASGLVAGVNTIEFEWGNGPAGGAGSQNPNPTHARVEFIAAGPAVPVSSHHLVPWLLLVLLGGLGVAALRGRAA